MKKEEKLPLNIYLDAEDIVRHISCHDGAKVAVTDSRNDIWNGENTVIKYTELSQLWHEPSDLPEDIGRQCLVEIGVTAGGKSVFQVLESCAEGFRFGADKILTQGFGYWAYIQDLFPTRIQHSNIPAYE